MTSPRLQLGLDPCGALRPGPSRENPVRPQEETGTRRSPVRHLAAGPLLSRVLSGDPSHARCPRCPTRLAACVCALVSTWHDHILYRHLVGCHLETRGSFSELSSAIPWASAEKRPTTTPTTSLQEPHHHPPKPRRLSRYPLRIVAKSCLWLGRTCLSPGAPYSSCPALISLATPLWR